MKKSISRLGLALLICLSIFSTIYINKWEPLNTNAATLELDEMAPRGDQLVKYMDFTNKVVKGIVEVIKKES